MEADPKDWLRLRPIRLVKKNGRLLVVPLCQGKPIVLPRLPLTLLLSCQQICRLFFSNHRRCLSLILLLDRKTLRWQSFLPTQRCTSQSARIDLQSSDFVDLNPTLLIAGSFQSSGTSGLLPARASIPPFDGLHVIQQRHRQASWIFIVRNGQPTLAHPAIVTIDDLKQAIDSATARLHLD